MKKTLLSLSLSMALGVACAKECKGVDFPEQIQADNGSLVLNGLGLRLATVFKVSVYVAALYVPKASGDPATILRTDTAKQIVVHFVRNVGVADLRKGWTEGFEKNANGALPALKDRIATFNSLMGDMKAGQRVILTYTPGAGVEVDVKGAAKETIKGDDFAKALFAIWLGDPPNPEIKIGLLGGTCG
jgi:chalcone isomerase-like protein